MSSEAIATLENSYGYSGAIGAENNALCHKAIESIVECEDKFQEGYQQDNYEMYEQLAMAYQSDVANQVYFILTRGL